MAFALVNVKEVHSAGTSIGIVAGSTKDMVVGWNWWFNEKKEVEIPPPIQQVPLILQKIRWCESRDRQFEIDGTIHRGKINPKDVGAFQINEHYHLDNSIELGYDIYTLSGNTQYALYLYKNQGTTPWNWSKPCWSQDLTLEQLKLKYK